MFLGRADPVGDLSDPSPEGAPPPPVARRDPRAGRPDSSQGGVEGRGAAGWEGAGREGGRARGTRGSEAGARPREPRSRHASPRPRLHYDPPRPAVPLPRPPRPGATMHSSALSPRTHVRGGGVHGTRVPEHDGRTGRPRRDGGGDEDEPKVRTLPRAPLPPPTEHLRRPFRRSRRRRDRVRNHGTGKRRALNPHDSPVRPHVSRHERT